METCKNSPNLTCPTLTFTPEQLEYYVGLGAKEGMPVMIKKIMVDNIDILERGVWCTDPSRAIYIIKENGIFIKDFNGQRLLDIIMPGLEDLFTEELDIYRASISKRNTFIPTTALVKLDQRQTMAVQIRNKKIRKSIAHELASSFGFNRNEILNKLEDANFDNINIIFDNKPKCTIEEIE